MNESIKSIKGQWKVFNNMDGLSHSCSSLLEDKSGYIWIGHRGSGLSRYDGKRFVNITKKNDLTGDNVRHLFQDNRGNIWVSTWGNGLTFYNREEFVSYSVDNGLASNSVNYVYQDGAGHIWAGTRSGLSFYKEGRFISYTAQDGLTSNRINDVRCLIQDKKGRILIGTWGGGLSLYEKQKFTNYTDRDGLADNRINCIHQDNAGNIWLGTESGLSRYNGGDFVNFTAADGLAADNVSCIYQDKDGNLWLGSGTNPAGLSCYDGDNFINFNTNDGLPSNTVLDIIQDREGNFWFACWQGGICRYNPYEISVLSSESVDEAMIQDKNDKIWWGFGNILSSFDQQGVQHYDSFKGPISKLLQDSQGGFWVGTKSEGAFRYDDSPNVKGQKPLNYTTSDGLADNRVRIIYESPEGKIWVGTNGGTSCYNGKEFVSFTTNDGLEIGAISAICQDKDKVIWYGSPWGGGISCYDGKSIRKYTEKDGLLDDRILCIMEDDKSGIWIGTFSGVSFYDRQSFRNYTVSDGLLGSVISDIYQDSRGQIWIATLGGGVSRFDGKNFQALTTEDGLPSSCITNIMEDKGNEPDSAGSLLISTYKGICRYMPNYRISPLIQIDEVDADQVYEQPQEIELPESVRSIRIGYHGICYKTNRMRYNYILEGYQQQWQATWDEEVRYERLPVGEYRFKVIAINKDLVCSEKTSELKIKVVLDPKDREIRDLEKKIEEVGHLAYHDTLTGLSNRLLLKDLLNLELAHAKRNDQILSLMYLDLDGFKVINDTLGHSAGDQFLKTFSSQLKRLLRQTDTAARLAGDEFAVLLPGINLAEDVAEIAQRVTKALNQPLIISGREFHITASIGISVYPDDGSDAETLLNNADVAMYRAKTGGKNQYQFYTSHMGDQIQKRMELENNLRLALERQEFVLHYQPRIDTKTGRVAGMEALIRWKHPKRGLVVPDKFIPMAEKIGLMPDIGRWVLQTACSQNKMWQDSGLPKMRVSVNLSLAQFRHKNLPGMVEKTLKETGLEANWLELEITESVMMQDIDHTIKTIDKLKKIGIRISIDDFGTGYSSLSHLKHMSIDVLKIDKSFVKDIGKSSKDMAIIDTIIALAKNLKVSVVAEGVEKQVQYDFIKKGGCDEVQGYLFCKPVPADKFEKIVVCQF